MASGYGLHLVRVEERVPAAEARACGIRDVRSTLNTPHAQAVDRATRNLCRFMHIVWRCAVDPKFDERYCRSRLSQPCSDDRSGNSPTNHRPALFTRLSCQASRIPQCQQATHTKSAPSSSYVIV